METDSDLDGNMIGVETGTSNYVIYFHGNDWHRTPLDAITRAEEMRVKKIASLRKSLAKMESMTFENVEETG